MQIEFGRYHAPKQPTANRIVARWDNTCLINPHIIVCGKTGTGKSYTLRRMVADAIRDPNIDRVHVFDVHGDLDMPDASEASFNEHTRFGYNPLEIDPDPEVGGIRKQINFIISAINQTATQLRDRQTPCLRRLLEDVYAASGIFADNPSTWHRQNITLQQRRAIIRQQNYKELRNYYPTLEDLLSYGERKLKMMYTGIDRDNAGMQAIRALEAMNRCAKRLDSTNKRFHRSASDIDQEKAEKAFDRAKDEWLDAAKNYADGLQTGREFNDIIAYTSKETLESVLDRLRNLNALGIFSPNAPPFDPSRKVWCYRLNQITPDEAVIFAQFRAADIFRKRLNQGLTSTVREVIVIDEAQLHFSDDKDNIFNRISLEARKFGLALWSATQNPNAFPEDVLTSVGAKVILGLDNMHWQGARRMGLTAELLRFIEPRKTLLLQMEVIGHANSRFFGVHLENEP